VQPAVQVVADSHPYRSTEPVGVLPAKITPANAAAYANPATHQGRLIAACLQLGAHSRQGFKALRRWAHMIGYRGHFATKSRTTPPPCAPSAPPEGTGNAASNPSPGATVTRTVITLTDLHWVGRGWRTTGDALLALSAAARAREHRRIAREETRAA
jgi:hypothetical protein